MPQYGQNLLPLGSSFPHSRQYFINDSWIDVFDVVAARAGVGVEEGIAVGVVARVDVGAAFPHAQKGNINISTNTSDTVFFMINPPIYELHVIRTKLDEKIQSSVCYVYLYYHTFPAFAILNLP